MRAKYLYFEGRSTGVKSKYQMSAVNIASPDDRPDWRVTEAELITWMRAKGIRYYERGGFRAI